MREEVPAAPAWKLKTVAGLVRPAVSDEGT